MQGDLPTIDARRSSRAALAPLDDPAVDIATLAPKSRERTSATNPNVVKVVGSPVAPGRLRALYFTRATAPSGDGPLYHHIGLYAYRRAALERFVKLPPSPLEQRERLEQLRALEAGMRIDVAIVDTVPLGVDTPEDLERARALLARTLAPLLLETFDEERVGVPAFVFVVDLGQHLFGLPRLTASRMASIFASMRSSPSFDCGEPTCRSIASPATCQSS